MRQEDGRESQAQAEWQKGQVMSFPTYVYRKSAKAAWTVRGVGGVAIKSIRDADELAAAEADGWVASVEHLNGVPSDDAPPSRDELVRKATELGIEFHHRTGNAKLEAMIAEALA